MKSRLVINTIFSRKGNFLKLYIDYSQCKGWVDQNNSTKSNNGLVQANRSCAQLIRGINEVDQFNFGKLKRQKEANERVIDS